MILRPLRTIQIVLFIFLFTVLAQAEDLEQEMLSVGAAPIQSDNEALESGHVVVETQGDPTQSYKKRRGRHGALFSISREDFYAADYRSLFKDSYFDEIVGAEAISLVGLELGYKYNLGAMSFAGLVAYSSGSINGSFLGADRQIQISRQGISVNAALDAFFEEPWVAPYAQAGLHLFSITETKTGTQESLSDSTGPALNYKFGLLFQLDWIENSFDKNAKTDRLRSSGLENTYIDFYYATHQASQNAIDPSTLGVEGDPNLFSSNEVGLGLKMEF